ncbi:YqzH family protein [Neobacillus kokaensis]|uniref:YqzH-like protein n=1 Tax=Neobacillus kokaensis TaxID=2759023 RepID=A0ABQ3NBZ7_9BACI|nr:YqzH family protein [Neobacillus kokaensis]GHI01425.1 hypothetical protein AM1BK_49670 [Neobacillus kokaensis]
MEKKFVMKMIKNCFKQYYEEDSTPITEKDLEELTNKVLQAAKADPDEDLYEAVNDAVYEFLIE